jgi:3'(2'), 5'-bisphosphate nucleotidase
MKQAFEPLLDDVIALAHAAGEAILQVYQTDFNVISKSDESPLTLADQMAEKIINEGLRNASQWPILSEESPLSSFEERKNWDYYWLVDPLDGTKEFVKKNGEFTVNIALIENHIPVLGVVYQPTTQKTYFAAHRIGAYQQEKDLPSKSISTRVLQPEEICIVGSRSHITEDLRKFMACLGNDVAIKSIGSSLKICLIAEGQADLYPRLGLTSEWDTAAAHCVLEEAGGHLTDLRLSSLRYNMKDSLLNPHFIAFNQQHSTWLNCLEQFTQR